MAFKRDAFVDARLEPRRSEVPVSDMAHWFDDGDQPVWRIRGLTGKQLGQANEAAERNKNVNAILQAIASRNTKKKAQGVKDLLGLNTEDMPQDIAKRIEILIMGSVEPECDLQLALKVCQAHPVEFFAITQEILRLTGQGSTLGKPMPSGVIQESAPA